MIARGIAKGSQVETGRAASGRPEAIVAGPRSTSSGGMYS
jgi:hypothetical protein